MPRAIPILFESLSREKKREKPKTFSAAVQNSRNKGVEHELEGKKGKKNGERIEEDLDSGN